MEMKLLEGETIVLEGGNITLTNKRLVTLKKKGFFNPYVMIDEEIFLDAIDEAHNESGGFFGVPTLNVKQKIEWAGEFSTHIEKVQKQAK